jgi:hypothetical protein
MKNSVPVKSNNTAGRATEAPYLPGYCTNLGPVAP